MSDDFIMKVWGWLGIVAVATLLVIFIFFVFSEKHVRGYYLGNNANTMTISVDIDWCSDPTIQLNGVTFQEAVRLVDSLNAHIYSPH